MENPAGGSSTTSPTSRFNSATAVNRGERGSGAVRPRHSCSFNSATAVNRGERRWTRWNTPPRPPCFNSATAVNRGELVRDEDDILARETLQFGHGGEPWRTSGWRCTRSRSRSFNSATAVNRGERPAHPGRRASPRGFNSATAVNRGERRPPGSSGSRSRSFNSATAVNRGERRRHADERQYEAAASIRPRR